MNITQARTIPCRNIFESFQIFPIKSTQKYAMYFAIDRDEKAPSLVLYFATNSIFDHGSGKKYDQISLVQEIKKCSISEALEYLSNLQINTQPIIQNSNMKNYTIFINKPVEHPALIDYLTSRKILSKKEELQEIHFESNGKKYFGVGFKNDSGGYEFSNSFQKLCLGKKDITTKISGNDKLYIFESWSDYLSFKVLFPSKNLDFIILNSVAMLNRIFEIIPKYKESFCYLDQDIAGSEATKILVSNFGTVDERELFRNFKDLNLFLVKKIRLRSRSRSR